PAICGAARCYDRRCGGESLMLAKALERSIKWALSAWRDLSLDAKVVAVFGVGNWLLLFANHTTVAATRDVPLWQLFPPGADAAFLITCGALAFTYPLRDRRADVLLADDQQPSALPPHVLPVHVPGEHAVRLGVRSSRHLLGPALPVPARVSRDARDRPLPRPGHGGPPRHDDRNRAQSPA